MKVEDRIEQAPACEIITLTDEELKIYKGCGWTVAGFCNGQLEKLHYALDFVSDPDAVSYTHLTLPTNREV